MLVDLAYVLQNEIVWEILLIDAIFFAYIIIKFKIAGLYCQLVNFNDRLLHSTTVMLY